MRSTLIIVLATSCISTFVVSEKDDMLLYINGMGEWFPQWANGQEQIPLDRTVRSFNSYWTGTGKISQTKSAIEQACTAVRDHERDCRQYVLVADTRTDHFNVWKRVCSHFIYGIFDSQYPVDTRVLARITRYLYQYNHHADVGKTHEEIKRLLSRPDSDELNWICAQIEGHNNLCAKYVESAVSDMFRHWMEACDRIRDAEGASKKGSKTITKRIGKCFCIGSSSRQA